MVTSGKNILITHFSKRTVQFMQIKRVKILKIGSAIAPYSQ